MKYTVRAGEAELELDIDHRGIIRLEGAVVDADLQPSLDPTLYSLILGHRSYELRVEPSNGSYRVQLNGVTYDVVVEDERTRLLAKVNLALGSHTGELPIKSPMPGVVVDVSVKEGDSVEAGQTMVVVESMKMHNEFKAPRAGIVKAVRVEPGTQVQKNTILVTLA
jgi:biotin carboxyl carrier protein